MRLSGILKSRFGRIITIGFVVFCVSTLYVYGTNGLRIDEKRQYLVSDVIDGDTFVFSSGRKLATARLLGIDTPETVNPRKPIQCYGKEASNELRSLIQGENVNLKLNPNREDKDKYGRFLVYAYLIDGTSINEHMIKNGFAREYTYGSPYIKQKAFQGLERIAKASRLGLWGICDEYEKN